MDDSNYGYILAPGRRQSAPGAAKLQVFLEDTPTTEHFDPKSVMISAFNDHGGVYHVTIEHPWPSERELRICAGPFDLVDRKGKHIEGFTYGGRLEIEVSDHSTSLTLDSPAPILVRPHHALSNLLAEESEILLAQRRATIIDEEALEQHLADADPLKLYRACLQALQERLQHLPLSDDQLMMKFKTMVRQERQAVEDILPGSSEAGLDELV
jgi:hypothetical protein